MFGNVESENARAVRKEYDEALEDGDVELAERIRLANLDLFPPPPEK